MNYEFDICFVDKSYFENSLSGRLTSSISLSFEIEFLKSILANENVEIVFWLFGRSKSLLSFFSVKTSVLFFAVSTIDIKSLVDISKVLDLEPRHFGALSGRAQIYIDLELYQKALIDLKDARKIHPVIRGNKLINELEKLINGENV